jgi:hypothetical protein
MYSLEEGVVVVFVEGGVVAGCGSLVRGGMQF